MKHGIVLIDKSKVILQLCTYKTKMVLWINVILKFILVTFLRVERSRVQFKMSTDLGVHFPLVMDETPSASSEEQSE